MKSKRIVVITRFAWLVFAFLAMLVTDSSAQIYHVKEMNTEQLRALEREKTVVLLPGGILEQHGPYLPSFTDGYQNERLTMELANAIVERPGWKVLIFPIIPLGVGAANEIGSKYSFSGSYTVRSSTLRAVFMDLATELGEAGFRWVFVVHEHGAPNHNRVLDQAGDFFHDTYGGHMVHLFGLIGMGQIGQQALELMNENERKEEGFGLGHASMGETSLLLFLRPDLVNPTFRQAPPLTASSMEGAIKIARAENWPGYFGSPRLANAAYGARLWKRMSSSFIDLALKILDGFDYKQAPRYGEVTRTLPANMSIDRAALEREQEVEKKQSDWLKKKGVR